MNVKLPLFVILTFMAMSIQCYKIVLFVPNMANSQVLFNKRVAETLANAGHNVTMVMLTAYSDKNRSNITIADKISVYHVNFNFPITKEQIEEKQAKIIFKDLSMWDYRLRENMNDMTKLLLESCKETIKNKEFLTWLENEKFDIAFSHMYHACPIGLVHVGKIPTWIWLNSGALMDFVAHYIGVPIIPSYVPPMMMESSDTMTFFERTKSLIGHSLTTFMWRRMLADKETALFREHVDPNFPDLIDIAKNSPLVMVNSNEMYDFPRPTIAKVVNIGGLGMEFKDAKPLTKEFKTLSETGKGLIVFSFGSVAPAHKMPDEWKTAFLNAFRRFPDYQFIMRYEGKDLEGKLPPNVHVAKWLPQTDLLQHPHTKAFISHGGYNSLQEVISAGVPLITLALFGDQPKNSKLAEKHGFSVNLKKAELSESTIVDAIEKVLTNDMYLRNVKRLSQMVRKKPVSPAHLVVKWTELLAEFKHLDNLVPAGNQLNFIQYYSLDVIMFLLSTFLVIMFLLYKVLQFVARKLYSILTTPKKQKTL